MAALGLCWASEVALVLKNLPTNVGDERDVGLISGLGRFPWRRKWQPTLVCLPGESHGQRSLVGWSPWGYTELDQLSLHTHMYWVFVAACGLSLVAASGGYSLAVVCRLLIAVVFLVAERRLYSTDSKFAVHGHCYPVACRIFQEQGLNPCPLHWHAGWLSTTWLSRASWSLLIWVKTYHVKKV